jgi:hypothetical protein
VNVFNATMHRVSAKLILHILDKNQAAGDGDLGETSVGIAFGGSGE